MPPISQLVIKWEFPDEEAPSGDQADRSLPNEQPTIDARSGNDQHPEHVTKQTTHKSRRPSRPLRRPLPETTRRLLDESRLVYNISPPEHSRHASKNRADHASPDRGFWLSENQIENVQNYTCSAANGIPSTPLTSLQDNWEEVYDSFYTHRRNSSSIDSSGGQSSRHRSDHSDSRHSQGLSSHSNPTTESENNYWPYDTYVSNHTRADREYDSWYLQKYHQQDDRQQREKREAEAR